MSSDVLISFPLAVCTFVKVLLAAILLLIL